MTRRPCAAPTRGTARPGASRRDGRDRDLRFRPSRRAAFRSRRSVARFANWTVPSRSMTTTASGSSSTSWPTSAAGRPPRGSSRHECRPVRSAARGDVCDEPTVHRRFGVTRPCAAQAAAVTTNGGSGRSSRQRAANPFRSGWSSAATYAPAGPTPSSNGCHHSSKVWCSTSIASSSSSMSASPASSSSCAR